MKTFKMHYSASQSGRTLPLSLSFSGLTRESTLRGGATARLSQSGRTLLETIGVLAIMGVLSVAAYYTFRVSLEKHTANAIVEDAQVAYIEIHSKGEGVSADWQEVTQKFKPVSENLAFYVKRDPLNNDYVKVTGIEQPVCYHLLGMQAKGKLSFYDDNNEKYTSCNATNDMIVAFNGQYAPAECATRLDCPVPEGAVEFEGICTSTGRCHTCDTLFETWDTETATCNCSETKGRMCSDDYNNSWCCSKAAFCGSDAGQCIEECRIEDEILCIIDNQNYWCCEDTMKCGRGQDEDNKCSDGKCWAEYKQPEGYENDLCMLRYAQEEGYEDELCEQTFTLTNPTALCQITFSNDASNLEVLEYDTCTGNTYCYIAYTNSARTSGVSANSKGTLYGTCSPMTEHDMSAGYTMNVPNNQCSGNRYCYIAYTNSARTAGITAKSTGTLYGTCSPMTEHDMSAGYTMTEPTPCTGNRYCYVAYTNANRTTPITAKSTGDLYGTCSAMSEHDMSGGYTFTERVGCPEGEYCSLQWKTNSTACTPLEAKTTGSLYGTCLPMKQNSGTCPYK